MRRAFDISFARPRGVALLAVLTVLTVLSLLAGSFAVSISIDESASRQTQAELALRMLYQSGAAHVKSSLMAAALSDTGYRAETMLDYLSSHVARLTVVDAERALKDVGSPKVLNLILLGAALRAGALGLETADLKEAIRRNIKEKFHTLNFRALEYEP